MKNNTTLNQLIRQDDKCRALYDQLSKDVQVALQEQRQDIRTRDELVQAINAFEKRSRK